MPRQQPCPFLLHPTCDRSSLHGSRNSSLGLISRAPILRSGNRSHPPPAGFPRRLSAPPVGG